MKEIFSDIGNIKRISQPHAIKAASTTAMAALYANHFTPDGILDDL